MRPGFSASRTSKVTPLKRHALDAVARRVVRLWCAALQGALCVTVSQGDTLV